MLHLYERINDDEDDESAAPFSNSRLHSSMNFGNRN